MAFVFKPDPSLPLMNAFCTVAEADDYQTTKLNTAWAALTTTTKEKLISWASRELDAISWIGVKTNPTQPMQFPRSYVPIDGGYTGSITDDAYSTYYFDPDEVIPPVKLATAELAGILAVEDTTADDGLSRFNEIKVESIALKINSQSRLSWMKPSIKNLCWRYMVNASPYNAPTQRVG